MAEPSIRWERFPCIAANPRVGSWLRLPQHLGLATNTILAYARALEHYLCFARAQEFEVAAASREQIALWVHALLGRPGPAGERIRRLDSGMGLANATVQQRLTAVRLFYDYLVEEGERATNPVGRGRYTPGKGFGSERGLVRRFHKLPWIPDDDAWRRVLEAARPEPVRNRLMLALAYDGALRREELCRLETGDVDPAHRLLHVRAETTKSRRARVVPYTALSSELYARYLDDRRRLSHQPGPLFLSESRRNRSQPVTIWTWSKVVERLAERSGVAAFTTHTLRHLRLTDLARSGWEVQAIAEFAGHRSTTTTLQYIHLSGRDLAHRLERGMEQVHAWRERLTAEVLR